MFGKWIGFRACESRKSFYPKRQAMYHHPIDKPGSSVGGDPVEFTECVGVIPIWLVWVFSIYLIKLSCPYKKSPVILTFSPGASVWDGPLRQSHTLLPGTDLLFIYLSTLLVADINGQRWSLSSSYLHSRLLPNVHKNKKQNITFLPHIQNTLPYNANNLCANKTDVSTQRLLKNLYETRDIHIYIGKRVVNLPCLTRRDTWQEDEYTMKPSRCCRWNMTFISKGQGILGCLDYRRLFTKFWQKRKSKRFNSLHRLWMVVSFRVVVCLVF